jgi:hypothetical protein
MSDIAHAVQSINLYISSKTISSSRWGSCSTSAHIGVVSSARKRSWSVLGAPKQNNSTSDWVEFGASVLLLSEVDFRAGFGDARRCFRIFRMKPGFIQEKFAWLWFCAIWRIMDSSLSVSSGFWTCTILLSSIAIVLHRKWNQTKVVPSTSSCAANDCETPCRLSSTNALGIPQFSNSERSPAVVFGVGTSCGAKLRLSVCNPLRLIVLTHITRTVPSLSASSSSMDLRPPLSRPGAASSDHSIRSKLMPVLVFPSLLVASFAILALNSSNGRRLDVTLRNDAICALAQWLPLLSWYCIAVW